MSEYMIGAELQCLREACGLNRDQFGALCGVQGRSIKYWEMSQSNHGVPADVTALIQELAAKVDAMAADCHSPAFWRGRSRFNAHRRPN